jgi:energy-converting hydrogenase Eha subunit E
MAIPIDSETGSTKQDPIITILSRSIPTEWVGKIAPAVSTALALMDVNHVANYVATLFGDVLTTEERKDLHDLITAMVSLMKHSLGG